MLDKATILGCILGLIVVAAGLAMGGINPILLFQPDAIIIVGGGTLTALLLQFSLPSLQNALGTLNQAFCKDSLELDEIVTFMVDAALYIRQNGILAIDPLLADIDHPFLKEGFQLLVDNAPVDQIRQQLTARMEVAYQREAESAKVFESAAGFTPTMGVLGAVVGLITALGSFSSPETLSQGIAGAFMSTLYGVGLANLFLVPISGKLTQKAKRSWFLKSVMLIGLVSLSRQESPSQLRQKLEAFQHQVQQNAQAVNNLNDAQYYQPAVSNHSFAATAQQEYKVYSQV